MKAITCSQCGALIKQIRERNKFADCTYCGAKIPIIKEKVIIVPDEKAETKPQFEKFTAEEQVGLFKSVNEDDLGYNAEEANTKAVSGILVGVFLFIFVIVIVQFSMDDRSKPENGETLRETTSTTFKERTEYSPSPTETPTPLPDISYRSYVKYTTSIGAEYLPLPTITAEQIPTYNIEELKKTVFKDKRIRVQITINTDGEVTDAKALNGHEVLRESSVKAAKQALFTTRKRESKTTLTYIYKLEE